MNKNSYEISGTVSSVAMRFIESIECLKFNMSRFV